MPAIRHTPDDLWKEFKLVLPLGKPARTVGGRLCHLEVLGWNTACFKNRMPVEGVEKSEEENYQVLAEFADCLIAVPNSIERYIGSVINTLMQLFLVSTIYNTNYIISKKTKPDSMN